VGGFDWAQAALFHPLLEMANGFLELLRPDLNPLLERPVMLVAFAPILDVNGLEQPHFLEKFKRADAAASFQGRLGRSFDAVLEIALVKVSHFGVVPFVLRIVPL